MKKISTLKLKPSLEQWIILKEHGLAITKKLDDNHIVTFLRDMALEVNLHGKYHAELAENEKLIEQLKAAKKET